MCLKVEFFRFFGRNFHHSPPFSILFARLSSYSASLLTYRSLVLSFNFDYSMKDLSFSLSKIAAISSISLRTLSNSLSFD